MALNFYGLWVFGGGGRYLLFGDGCGYLLVGDGGNGWWWTCFFFFGGGSRCGDGWLIGGCVCVCVCVWWWVFWWCSGGSLVSLI